MLLILSGEGGSDVGGSSGFGDRAGPMAHVVDQLIEDRLNYSPIACGMVRWYSRKELSLEAKSNKFPKIGLPGLRREKGHIAHYKQAHALALIAKNIEKSEGVPTLSVMFRDSDGTNSAPADHWDQLTSAIENGYRAADYHKGVAMVPRPKQESWLLCAIKQDPYVGCQALEEESGNDGAPRSLKLQLAEALGAEPSVDDMCNWITTRRFDSSRVDMVSFERFKSGLATALDRVVEE